jgi:hypothetical protein
MKLGENLNKTFDCVYLRNLPEAVTRRQSFEITANSIGLKYKTINGIKGYDYVPPEYQIKRDSHLYPYPANQYLMGNFYSFTYMLLDAMSNGYDSFLYCDDDTIFYDMDVDFIKPHLPHDWDVILLGRLHRITNTQSTITFRLTNSANDIAGSFCVGINKKFYFKLLHNLFTMDTSGQFGDRLFHYLALRNEAKVYVGTPDISYQERDLLIPYKVE